MPAPTTTREPAELPEFSLMLGGPLFQLLVRSRLTTPALDLVTRRIVFLSLFAWLPLLLLSFFDGRAWGSNGLPFLYDLEMHARFLAALPLAIVAELLVHQRLRVVIRQFIERRIITEPMLPKFRDVIASAMKLRNSVAIELVLFGLVVFGGYYLWSTVSGLAKIGTESGSWYATASTAGTRLTPAGYWYVYVSRPLFQFIIARWYFRLFIWARFLWQTSRLKLELNPIHPDKAAGLGFLGLSTHMFAPLLMAHGALLAGLMANPIFFGGAKLTDFKMEIVGAVGLLLLIILGPLLAFSPSLAAAKRHGLREHGALASQAALEFERKWLREVSTASPPLQGMTESPSMLEAGRNLDVVRSIQLLPFGRDTVLQLVVIVLIPIAPLTLTLIPLEQMVSKLLNVFF